MNIEAITVLVAGGNFKDLSMTLLSAAIAVKMNLALAIEIKKGLKDCQFAVVILTGHNTVSV